MVRLHAFMDHETYDMDEHSEDFLDLSKSKVFKECWHKSDLRPQGLDRYKELREIADAVRNSWTKEKDTRFLLMRIFEWLGQAECIEPHRRVYKDLREAFGMVSLFFTDPDTITEITGIELKDSTLLNQSKPAEDIDLDRKPHNSCNQRPKDFFPDVKHFTHGVQFKGGATYPTEWDEITRPIIAKLFREGIIESYKGEAAAGYAIAATDPSNGLQNMFIDYRAIIDECHLPSTLQDLTVMTNDALKSQALKFNKKHSNARFAVLRLWTHELFLPLILGMQNRAKMSFADCIDRVWSWKFMPKDFPYSEWSIHNAVRFRMQPFMKLFQGKIIVRRDLFVIMGENTADLRRMAMAVTFAIQTKPWRLEVDFWRSFVNVDYAFLEALHGKWLD